jgi:hypothetical protein
MERNGKPIGFLESVDLFSDTMNERHMSGGTANGMLIIASDGDNSTRIIDGNHNTLLDALSTILYKDEGLFDLIESALALAIVARLKSDDDDTD